MRRDDLAGVGPHPGAGAPPATALPAPRFDHLRHMTHPLGVWEHAELTTPRVAHGFCTDDNARALIVVSRDTTADRRLDDLAGTYLQFVLDARTHLGQFRNRRSHDGTWLDDRGSDDSQGRAWWALGVVARLGRQSWMCEAGISAFDARPDLSSVHLRANAFTVFGAAEALSAHPGHTGAESLLRLAVEPLTAAATSHVPWFEPRLTYDNARLPEALLAAGTALGDARMVHMGLRLLSWLVDVETRDGHFSFVPTDGWAPGEQRPGFDQQPLEAAAMAEACHRAWTVTGDERWRARGLRAAQWFLGSNDTGAVLYDVASGGTYDGLMTDGVNLNQGAESTLAGLAALQVAEAFGIDEPLATSP